MRKDSEDWSGARDIHQRARVTKTRPSSEDRRERGEEGVRRGGSEERRERGGSKSALSYGYIDSLSAPSMT
jgi:hypothetical protein